MREMHKWKDKVELSLDNRQIFFLFFGLSVVGCFVFALGVMTGRRVDWEPEGEVAAAGQPSLALLDGAEDPAFDFEKGLDQSAAEGLPETRDPAVPPRDEDQVKADRAAKAAAAALPEAAPAKSPAPDEPTLVSTGTAAPAAASSGPRAFTLQMKAFSRADEAEQMADKLRRNGHDVRVEQAVVRGRSWHRVRLGRFAEWDEAVAAKHEFEQTEHLIAYVVSE